MPAIFAEILISDEGISEFNKQICNTEGEETINNVEAEDRY